ncbi:MAG: CHAT domain-containing protein [Burkholderiales bacterium]
MAKEKEPARAALRRAPVGPRPAVFLLPGIMGSHLNVNGSRVWLDKGALMFGGLGKLKMNGAAITADPFLEDYYNDLAGYLAQTHEVIRFPYDWRRSVLDAGERLAQAITTKLDELEPKGQPVRILAHSMGGLVARAMIAQHKDVWERMTAHESARLVMLGTPNGGSHEIVRLLTGRATTLQALALLDFARGAKGLLDIICRFPGVLELLPIANDFECLTPELWAKLRKNDEDTRFHWEPPKAADLKQALAARKTIESVALDPKRAVYVAGSAPATPIGWRIETQFDYDGIRGHWPSIVFSASGRGDGQVPWATGIPAGIKAWYLDAAVHGNLPSHAPAFPAYLELLETGDTTRLPASPSAEARAAAEERAGAEARVFDMPIELPPDLPGQRDLAATVLGAKPVRRTKAKPRLAKTKVSITHGDLAYARHPVAAGHYRGDTIVNAEEYLDRALDGRLRDRSLLDLYPGALGTYEVLLNPDKHGKPGGAVVVGLGQVGELTPGGLTTAAARAFLGYSLEVAECPDDRFGDAQSRAARITTLLIGTGAGGMTVRDSIEAILRGVASANRRLSQIGLSVSITEVEFIELWQDTAIHAARELERALSDGEVAGLFEWRERCITDGQGGRRRVVFEEPPNWWHRLVIAHDSERDELRFIALTDRARAEETLVAGQRRIADDFIRRAIEETTYDRDVARTLFEILMPNRLKQLAPNQENVVLLVDETSGSYPWELLEDRWGAGNRPIAVTSGILRQLKSVEFRERPAIPFQDTAFVVGNPVLPPARADFPFLELPGAEREAAAVADFLQANGFTVKRQIHTPARAILADLHSDGYRILHLAGHGMHEWNVSTQAQESCPACERPLPDHSKKVSGMLIGDGVFLTPGDVEQMRWVPELVFINCCHLGRLNGAPWIHYSQLAANLAAQFIRMGVKAVIAAGWAVDDAAAETFAIALYSRLLDQQRFGDAVREARAETFDQHPNTNTWGAYQCYGDPAYRLRPGTQSTPKPRGYVTPAQIVVELENVASRARMGGGTVADAKKMEDAIERNHKKWLERVDVCEALGLAYGELSEYEDAVRLLTRALAGEKAEVSLRTIEQLANFKTRLAEKIADGPGDRGRAQKLLTEAISNLDELVKWGATSERLCLLGSAYKRQAQFAVRSAAKDTVRDEALRAMEKYYKEAHEKILANGELSPYPLLNWWSAKILLEWQSQPSRASLAELDKWCARAVAESAEKEKNDPDFWTGIVAPNCEIVRALGNKNLEKKKHEIVAHYQRAIRRGASQREVDSVVEHLDFIIELASAINRGSELKKQLQALKEIRDSLAELGGK